MPMNDLSMFYVLRKRRVKLAEKHVFQKDAELAALFHDIAKFMDKEKLKDIVIVKKMWISDCFHSITNCGMAQ